MDRTQFIRELIVDPRRVRDSQIVGGLIQCLTMREAVDLLDREFTQPYNVRVGLTRRLTRDHDRKSTALRQRLLRQLTPLLSTLPSARRAACGALILALGATADEATEDEVIATFAGSSNGNLRKQALRRIREAPTRARLELLASLLQKHRDFQIAVTLLRIGDRGVLKNNFGTIEDVVAGNGYWLGRLYLLLEAKGEAKLDRLHALDPVSWLYVAAKLHRPVDEAVLLKVFADNMFEGRSGLIAWCAGQLRAWNALVLMEQMTLDPPKELVDRHFQSIGLRPSDLLTPPTRPTY